MGSGRSGDKELERGHYGPEKELELGVVVMMVVMRRFLTLSCGRGVPSCSNATALLPWQRVELGVDTEPCRPWLH